MRANLWYIQTLAEKRKILYISQGCKDSVVPGRQCKRVAPSVGNVPSLESLQERFQCPPGLEGQVKEIVIYFKFLTQACRWASGASHFETIFHSFKVLHAANHVPRRV